MGSSILSVMLVKPGTPTTLGAVKKKRMPLPPLLMLAKENRSSYPLGEIALPVQFGTIKNFCTEYVYFLMADFDTANHAILGRLALAKFMAIPHYSYLVLKMSVLRGVLTMQANLTVAYACKTKSLTLAKVIDLYAHMEACLAKSKKVPSEEQEIPTLEPPRAATKAKETKEVDLNIDDKNKTAKTRANLDPK
ncbi:uncharacterized protein [Miscanthus floridulus]|uniref:uncharacterized protein n=1 Tax=Miscanthus floridulus TaxID=154761 RepID=UPI003458FD28